MGEPTEEPTEVPTADPTVMPTLEPTLVPTAEPTQEPTFVPTELPTLEPTDEPTTVPTIEPSNEPTGEPTIPPTHNPTEEPTLEPTSVPTAEPTTTPTELPTAQPTRMPTGCLSRGSKMHVLFKAAPMLAVRRLLAAVWAAAGLSSDDAEVLKNALAGELGLSPSELTMQLSTSASTGVVHTEFYFHNLNAIKLGHQLEQRVVSNQFNPLPHNPIYRLYLEEVFDCGAHAAGAAHHFDGTNGGSIQWTHQSIAGQ